MRKLRSIHTGIVLWFCGLILTGPQSIAQDTVWVNRQAATLEEMLMHPDSATALYGIQFEPQQMADFFRQLRKKKVKLYTDEKALLQGTKPIKEFKLKKLEKLLPKLKKGKLDDKQILAFREANWRIGWLEEVVHQNGIILKQKVLLGYIAVSHVFAPGFSGGRNYFYLPASQLPQVLQAVPLQIGYGGYENLPDANALQQYALGTEIIAAGNMRDTSIHFFSPDKKPEKNHPLSALFYSKKIENIQGTKYLSLQIPAISNIPNIITLRNQPYSLERNSDFLKKIIPPILQAVVAGKIKIYAYNPYSSNRYYSLDVKKPENLIQCIKWFKNQFPEQSEDGQPIPASPVSLKTDWATYAGEVYRMASHVAEVQGKVQWKNNAIEFSPEYIHLNYYYPDLMPFPLPLFAIPISELASLNIQFEGKNISEFLSSMKYAYSPGVLNHQIPMSEQESAVIDYLLQSGQWNRLHHINQLRYLRIQFEEGNEARLKSETERLLQVQ